MKRELIFQDIMGITDSIMGEAGIMRDRNTTDTDITENITENITEETEIMSRNTMDTGITEMDIVERTNTEETEMAKLKI
jgi:hypothetical protein